MKIIEKVNNTIKNQKATKLAELCNSLAESIEFIEKLNLLLVNEPPVKYCSRSQTIFKMKNGNVFLIDKENMEVLAVYISEKD
jgi:hypothetical protein